MKLLSIKQGHEIDKAVWNGAVRKSFFMMGFWQDVLKWREEDKIYLLKLFKEKNIQILRT